jgi:hypothetical protein
MIIILLVTHKYILIERWRCTLEAVWISTSFWLAYVWITATLSRWLSLSQREGPYSGYWYTRGPRLGPNSDDYVSDDVLMAKTVRGELVGIKMSACSVDSVAVSGYGAGGCSLCRWARSTATGYKQRYRQDDGHTVSEPVR